MNAVPHPGSLADLLVARGLLGRDQLRIAGTEAARTQRRLDRLLVDLGFISETALRDALAESLGTVSIDLALTIPEADALALLPRAQAIRHRALPLAFDAERQCLVLATADAGDIVALDRIRSRLPPGTRIDLRLAGEADILQAIDRHYGCELSIDGILQALERQEPTAADGERSPPVVRLIDALLADAVRREASDIHFEPEAGYLRIRYRIDGTLRQIRALHAACWPAMAVRIKVLAGLDIAETRSAQDGACQLVLGGRRIDFRVAAHPTLHGENIVLRILDRQKGIVPLDRLGLADARRAQLLRMIARPEGLILVTGPTGSGKTTTLYSLLAHVSDEGINVMTLEDPVEYPMPLLRQSAVAEGAKRGFADGVRSLLRQDPDVILIGEIRDAETASMAFRAAMTGHQVYSTLHSNSAAGAIPRLLDLGVSPEIVADSLAGIVAQRLLRRLCPHCRRPATASADECRLLGLPPAAETPTLQVADGCPHCDFQGYRGRLAIMEILPVDAATGELIARRASLRDIRERATAAGFVPLADDGARQVLAGQTSLAELMRVVDLGERLPP